MIPAPIRMASLEMRTWTGTERWPCGHTGRGQQAEARPGADPSLGQLCRPLDPTSSVQNGEKINFCRAAPPAALRPSGPRNKHRLPSTGNARRGLVASHGRACPFCHVSLGPADFIRGSYKSLNATLLRGAVGCTVTG